MRRMRVLIAPCIVISAVCLLIACQKIEQDQKSVLTKKATDYWQAKISKNIQKTYEYEDPEFKKKVSFNDYAMYFGGAGIQWLEAVIEKVDIQGTDAKVYTKIRYYSLSSVPFQQQGRVRTIADTWRLIDGTWYHLMTRADKAGKADKADKAKE